MFWRSNTILGGEFTEESTETTFLNGEGKKIKQSCKYIYQKMD